MAASKVSFSCSSQGSQRKASAQTALYREVRLRIIFLYDSGWLLPSNILVLTLFFQATEHAVQVGVGAARATTDHEAE